MKQLYVIVFPEKPNVKNIKLRGYAGRYKRIDILGRVFLLVGNYAKKYYHVKTHGVFYDKGELTVIEYEPNNIVYNSEKQAVLDILKALKGRQTMLNKEIIDIENYFRQISKEYRILLLSENGDDLDKFIKNIHAEGIAYIMGAHKDPPVEIVKYLRRLRAPQISIGPYSYLTTHVLSYLIWRSVLLDNF